MGRGLKIVHLKAHGLNSNGVQFVSFEQTNTGSSSSFKKGNRYFLTAPSLDSESIRCSLAQINFCVEHEIELVDQHGRVVQRGSIENHPSVRVPTDVLSSETAPGKPASNQWHAENDGWDPGSF